MNKPLDGITVLDFSRVLAAPYATQSLAELGATVIKIERPGHGDETRGFPPRHPGGESGYFFAFNRGKHSVALDLKSARGAEIARGLATRADVVVENFLPGVMEKLGLGYERLSAANPDLVHVAMTGFGQEGPWRDERGYDTVFQALSGIMSMTGHPDGPPAKAGIPVSDLTSGLWVAIAALTGLVGRDRSGHGCYVDLSMMDVQLTLSTLAAARIFALDDDPHRTGTEHPGRVPSAAFACADGDWLHISVSDQHWRPLCAALGIDELGQRAHLATNAGRVEHRDEVREALEKAFSSHDRDTAAARLRKHGVPMGEVRSVREALSSDHARARGVVGSFDHPTEGAVPALRTPLRLRGYDDPEIAAPPVLGADTDRVLSDFLGLASDELEALRSEGVIQ